MIEVGRTCQTRGCILLKLHVGEGLDVAPSSRGSIGIADSGVLGLDVLDGILVCRSLGSGENREEEGRDEEGKDLGELHVGG